MRARFHVAVWHGEHGSIFRVVDRRRNRIMGERSTMRDGIHARQLMDIQCAALNRGYESGTLAPPVFALRRSVPK